MLILGFLLMLLGLLCWVLAGLLPVIKLQRGANGTTTVVMEVTWMGIVTLSRQVITGVHGARLVRDPAHPDRVRVELAVTEGWRALSNRPLRTNAPRARVVQLIDRFAKEARAPEVTLPLRGRMGLMLGFALLFPSGTVALLVGALLILQNV